MGIAYQQSAIQVLFTLKVTQRTLGIHSITATSNTPRLEIANSPLGRARSSTAFWSRDSLVSTEVLGGTAEAKLRTAHIERALI